MNGVIGAISAYVGILLAAAVTATVAAVAITALGEKRRGK